MKYRVKSQLYSDTEAIKQGILDDCGPSSAAAAVSWASGYTADFSASDGVAAKAKATGKKEKQGVSDNGSSLPELIKTVKVLGGSARPAKSWADAMEAGKKGAALIIWVQQAVGYDPAVKISKWHEVWKSYWTKKDPKIVKAGYGHMTSAGWSQDLGWQWACPTRDDRKKSEKFGVPVTEAQLRAIASSKVKVKKAGADYKCVVIVTHSGGKVAAPKPLDNPTPVVAPETTPPPAPRIVAEAPRSHAEPRNVPKGVKTPDAVQAQLNQLGKADWGAIATGSLAVLNAAAAATGKEQGMNRIFAGLKYIADNTQVDEIVLDFVKTFLTVSISVALGLGIPLLDIQGGDFRTIVSAGLASGLGIVVKALDRDNSSYGLTRK